MKYTRSVTCPICGKMNVVPDNLEELLGTVAFRGKDSPSRIEAIANYLSDLQQDVRERVLNLLRTKEKIDPNDWIDIECLNRKRYGRHTFLYNLKTGEVSK